MLFRVLVATVICTDRNGKFKGDFHDEKQTDSVRLDAGCTKRIEKSSGGGGGSHLSVRQ